MNARENRIGNQEQTTQSHRQYWAQTHNEEIKLRELNIWSTCAIEGEAVAAHSLPTSFVKLGHYYFYRIKKRNIIGKRLRLIEEVLYCKIYYAFEVNECSWTFQ